MTFTLIVASIMIAATARCGRNLPPVIRALPAPVKE